MTEASSRVLLLNGVGSAGKSSVARALQGLAADAFLHVPMDAFLEMLPERSFDTPEGLTFRPDVVEGSPVVHIDSGPLAVRTFRSMRKAVGVMADMGLNLIVDDVADADDIADYREILRHHDVTVIGVFASLSVLESRERQRGDRMIGLARAQFDAVHDGIEYELIVTTDDRTALECATEIVERLQIQRIT